MYLIFIRTWWKSNPDWPNGKEPHMGRKKYLTAYNPVRTEGEAREICANINKTIHKGPLSRKAEYERK